MEARVLDNSFNQKSFDQLATHFVQSWEWGEVRRQTGTKVIRIGFFEGETLTNTAQMTLHPIPTIGKMFANLARSNSYSKGELDELAKIGQAEKAIAIRLEPNVILHPAVIVGGEERVTPESASTQKKDPGLSSATPNSARMTNNNWPMDHPKLKKSSQFVFVPNNFLVDLTKTEDELLAAMHPKTRYNIRVAQKNGVIVEESTNEQTLEEFITLQKKTSKRQQFYLHPDAYYRTVFTELSQHNMVHLLVAKDKEGHSISIWFLVTFKDTITYLYGASDHEYRQLMGNNLIAWEALRLGKKLELKTFDFGGTYSNITNQNDPRFGVHRFKAGFGGQHITYAGTYDLVIEPIWYQLFSLANTLRWWLLRLKMVR